MSSSSTVRIVLIPADNNAPLQEFDVPRSEEKEVECVMDFCKEYFQKIGQTDVEKARESVLSQLGDKVAHLQGAELEQLYAQIDQMSMNQMLECHALMNNKKATNFNSVVMYIDDMGMAKNLPSNQRATELSMMAGRGTRVLGDCFVGRYFDNEEKFIRSDFGIQDLTGSWLGLARETNPTASQVDASVREMKNTMQQAKKAKVVEMHAQSCGYGECHNKGTKRCARCKKIYYCSAECQKKDWSRHKPICK